MRSYHRHVETLLSDKQTFIPRKPCFRASAIFPVRQDTHTRSRILFMGYWKAKRDIGRIECVSTLRSQDGQVLTRHSQSIEDWRAHRIELADLLQASGLSRDLPFEGSIETEFYSAENLFFPFPAVVVNYYGPTFSSAVHSAQRVYNDYEDYQETSVQTVPESGFNIYSDGDREGFFTLINGPEEVENSLVRLEVFNHKGDRLEGTIELGPLAPYQCEWVTLSDHMDLQDFLEGQVGCCKMHFAVNWIYPRLIVGNYLQSKHALNVTHSYYDCTDAKSSGDYWHSAMEDWYPANLMLPLTVGKGEVTNAYFYPIISPSTLAIHAEIYSASGQLLGRKERALTIRSPAQSQYCIPFQEICRELDIDTHQSLGGRVLCETIEGGRIPARLKIGLDLGFTGKGLPCNVCTNLLPFNPSLEHKPHCFRWAPILADQEHSSVWLLNSSPAKAYHRSATVNLVFFREEDDHTLTRQITLAPHGHLRIAAEGDDELRSFLKGRIGWFTASSDCPYISSYFFTQHASGVVGGDHGF